MKMLYIFLSSAVICATASRLCLISPVMVAVISIHSLDFWLKGLYYFIVLIHYASLVLVVDHISYK